MKRFVLIWTLLAPSLWTVANDSTDPIRPNVIWIVVDDLGYADLSCTGIASDVDTPHIDSLAIEGIRFSNAYATAPICNASRVALMTGCYQQRQNQFWYGGPGLHDPDFETLAETLKREGYATGHVGKFHHGANDGPDGRGFPLNHGFDFLYGFSGGTKHYLHHSREYQKNNDMLHEGPMWVQNEQKDVEGFTTELFGDQATRFIGEHKNEPFYLHLSFNAVHNFTNQLPTEYLEAKGLKQFADWDPSEESYWGWRAKLGYPALAEGRDYYLGHLSYLDREIGRVLTELDELGIREQTIIAFVSDNGGSLVTYANNGEFEGGKYTLFEGGTRVPMIVSYPEMLKSNVVNDSLASTMDLYPTICGLTGSSVPSGLDGVDLMQVLLKGRSIELDRGPLFWDTNHQAAIRMGRWKYLVTQNVPNSKLQIAETPIGTFLYDLEEDPGETMNLDSQFPEIREMLSKRLETWRQAISLPR